MKKILIALMAVIASIAIAGQMDVSKPHSDTKKGAAYADAYHRISSVTWEDGKEGRVVVDIYASEEAFAAGKEPVDSTVFRMPFDLDSKDNFVTQAKTFYSK